MGYCYLYEISEEVVNCVSYNMVIVFINEYVWIKVDGKIDVYVLFIDNCIDVGVWFLIFGVCFEKIKIIENMYKLNKDVLVFNGVYVEKFYDVVLLIFLVMYKVNDLWNIFVNYGKFFVLL